MYCKSLSRGLDFPRILSIVSRCVALLVLFSIGFSTVAQAATSNDIPTRSEIQGRLDAIGKQKNLTEADKLTQQDLTHTLEYLDTIDRVRQETAQLKQQATQAPAKLRQAADDLAALSNNDVATASLEALSLRQLETRLNESLDNLQSAQENLSTYNSQLISLQTQPERVQSALTALSQRSQKIRNQLNGVEASQNALRSSQQALLQTEQALVGLQMEQQRKSLEVNTTLQDLLQKQRDYASAQINQLEKMVQALQSVLNGKRLTLSEKTAKEAQTSEDAQRIQDNPLVKGELETNHQLSQRLVAATQSSNTLVQESIQVKNWLDRTLQSERNLKEQVTVLKGSLLLSRILYQQQLSLPSASSMNDMSTQIADLRLEQFEINQQRDVLFRGDEYISKLMAANKGVALDDEVHDALGQILDTRRELLDQLNKQLGNQLMLAINLQINRQQLVSVTASLQHTLTQQIFWVSSNKPMDWTWLKELPGGLKQQVRHSSLAFQWDDWRQGALRTLLFIVPMLLVSGLIYWRRRLIAGYIERLSNDVGQLKRDSQRHTPQALLLETVMVLPGIMLILAFGLCFHYAENAVGDAVWGMSQQFALLWLVFGVLYRAMKPGGIGERHFNFSVSLAAHYRRQALRLGGALLPLIFWSVIGEKAPLYLVDDVIGQIVIFCNLILLGILVFPLCRDSWREKETHTIRLIVITVMAILPLVLLGLMVCGYFYTTLRLLGRWVESLYLLLVWNLVYLTTIRGLSVAARRLAYRRAVARRQSLNKEGAEGSEPAPEPPLALDQIGQQSLRLTTMVLLLIFSGVLYWIWSDLVTVMSYLDSITLWHYNATVAGNAVLQAVTLGNLMLSVVVAVVAYVLMRNLPGLLEVLVLSRLQLRQGTSYAITTMLSYLIMAVGTTTSLSSIGVSWDKLQWLVTALLVGLGFGLQEIFANFISGLIILFERPVRIGDTITIGTYSGSVSKIRIRATTITDFDRKEVIIPNKAFVTERLINWSLSDTITRVLIKIGVAYGSDLDKVKAVLLQAAHENSRVMIDPEPQVFFLAFGASSLDHELRLYVRELRDRSYTVDELNRSIDRLCRENNIDIAFNQLEVYLHNKQGSEVQEINRALGGNAAGEPA
ncbi:MULTISPECIES: mechanosensitive channel MscK [unclassified Symbiopectobacterium]|uniref:mechanosensitive channel MscK n=1 Tax=unclassified Symbiopectobacterium TaxID=2794573 RepID=UPI002227484B|nr:MULTISPECIES: mechanosensitive channel MscK [unclassified Symbiopectobacterium]MCW2474735.1 mechanosensitive channel MscK [Candidatus Symbiopectobacterium sp. NZEC151]MCW2487537.1 mechanosensitive channel MscK [Candidatus Symbiopectobacterium sp. NZEC127]